MKRYSFFSKNQRKKILYCSLEGNKDRTFGSYKKEFEKESIPLIPLSNLNEAKNHASDDASEIIGFILHFNWGETNCREFIDFLKKTRLLFDSSFVFMLFDSRSSEERKKAFVWGAKEILDPDDSKSIGILKDHFISYYGDFKSSFFSNLNIGFLDDSENLVESFQNFLAQRELDKTWSFFTSMEDWKKNQKPFDLVVIDYRFDKFLGTELIEEIKDSNPKALVFIISNFISPEIEKICRESKADFTLSKPRDFNLILPKIYEAYVKLVCRES